MAQLEELGDIESFEITNCVTALPALSIVNVPFYPVEVITCLNDISLGSRKDHNAKDYSYPIWFKDEKLRIQTPICALMFGLRASQNPGATQTNYSIHLSLKGGKQDMLEFRTMLTALDNTIKSMILLPPEKYFSPVRHNYANPGLPPILRVKLKTNYRNFPENNLDCTIYHNGVEEHNPPISVTQYLLNNNKSPLKVRCVIELRNVWVAGDKFGVSWSLVQLQIVEESNEPLFR